MKKVVKGILITLGVLVVLALIATPVINSIYEGQSEKARDTTRIVDLMLIRSGLEQSYSDELEFPNSLNHITTLGYLPRIPEDSKKGETINGCTFGYKYEVYNENGLDSQKFRLSTCLESKANKNKLTSDGGIYDNRLEVGNF